MPKFGDSDPYLGTYLDSPDQFRSMNKYWATNAHSQRKIMEHQASRKPSPWAFFFQPVSAWTRESPPAFCLLRAKCRTESYREAWSEE